MLYFLYGEDTYRSRKKLNGIIEEYRKKAGTDLNLHKLDAELCGVNELKNAIETGSLFANKKLIVIENICSPKGDPDAVADFIEEASHRDGVILLLWDRDANKKSPVFLAASKSATKAQEFARLTGSACANFIKEEARERGVSLDARTSAYLSSFGDSWGIINELEKMLVMGTQYAFAPHAGQDARLFSLGDMFFNSPKHAISELAALIHQGQDEFHMFSYLAGHARNLIVAKYISEAKKSVAPALGIHPFVFKKASALARMLPWDYLGVMPRTFLEEDFKAKTGGGRPQESLFSMLFKSKK